MVKIIMHGCNGKMGQVISGLIAADPDMELVAGIDARDDGHNPYPVFTDIYKCDVAADAIIDFSAAVAVDKLLDYCVEKKLPCVLCTTGLSEAQLAKVDEAAKKVAILKSANMSLGINLMLKLLKEAARSAGQRRLRYGDCGEAPQSEGRRSQRHRTGTGRFHQRGI